jgi:hypothetical protein
VHRLETIRDIPNSPPESITRPSCYYAARGPSPKEIRLRHQKISKALPYARVSPCSTRQNRIVQGQDISDYSGEHQKHSDPHAPIFMRLPHKRLSLSRVPMFRMVVTVARHEYSRKCILLEAPAPRPRPHPKPAATRPGCRFQVLDLGFERSRAVYRRCRCFVLLLRCAQGGLQLRLVFVRQRSFQYLASRSLQLLKDLIRRRVPDQDKENRAAGIDRGGQLLHEICHRVRRR